jgi:protein-S-isoprenylcysteine O-methyltransferase Ste14
MAQPDSPRIFTPPPLLFLAGLTIGLAVDGRLDGDALSAPAWQQIAGALLAVVAICLIVASLGLFRRSGTSPEPWSPASILVATGPYRVTRNPMYLGLAILHCGIALALGSIAAALMLIPLLAIMNFAIIPREEAYLERRFGENYRAYRRKTRRWI